MILFVSSTHLTAFRDTPSAHGGWLVRLNRIYAHKKSVCLISLSLGRHGPGLPYPPSKVRTKAHAITGMSV